MLSISRAQHTIGSTIPDPALVAALIEANARQYAMPPSQLDLISAAGEIQKHSCFHERCIRSHDDHCIATTGAE
jgi:hypothetical protein